MSYDVSSVRMVLVMSSGFGWAGWVASFPFCPPLYATFLFLYHLELWLPHLFLHLIFLDRSLVLPYSLTQAYISIFKGLFGYKALLFAVFVTACIYILSYMHVFISEALRLQKLFCCSRLWCWRLYSIC